MRDRGSAIVYWPQISKPPIGLQRGAWAELVGLLTSGPLRSCPACLRTGEGGGGGRRKQHHRLVASAPRRYLTAAAATAAAPQVPARLMLNRKPTRIELKAEDKEEVRRGAEGAMCLAVARLTRCSGCCCTEQRCRSEFRCWMLLRTTATRHRPVPPQYEAVRAERQQAQLQAAAAAAGKAPLSPLFTVRRPAVGGWSGWGEKRRRLACAPSCCIRHALRHPSLA